MELKDKITLLSILATFIVAFTNLIYMILNNRKTAFVNTVTASRLKWIDSLRDKVSSFIAITVQILMQESTPEGKQGLGALLCERDTLAHQIILHLNPNDSEDQAIQGCINMIVQISNAGISPELQKLLEDLRNATQIYLKKEWTRVKRESQSGEQR